jgi:hypothetical protein
MDTAIYIARWAGAIPAGLLFALCAFGNWSIIVAWGVATIRRQDFSSSFVLPFFGPPLGVLFVALLPISDSFSYWWTAFLIEPTWLVGLWMLLTYAFVDHST